jgi:hypothetical protein
VQLVQRVTKESMLGDTLQERAVNALLTRTFIGRADVPADECLSEAKKILAEKMDAPRVNEYLRKQFGPGKQPDAFFDKVATEVVALCAE